MIEEEGIPFFYRNVSDDCAEGVTAIMKTSTDLLHAVEALHARGFRKSDVSVLVPVTSGRQDLSFEKSSKVFKGTVFGALIGMLVASALGLLGLNNILIFPSSMKDVSDQVPWMIVLSIVGIGLLIGSTVGAIVGNSIPEYVTRLCERSVQGGTMVVAVHVDNYKWRQRAVDILKYYRAKDIVSNRKV